MDLKKALQAILDASPTMRDARIRKLKPVRDRFIIYLTSPTFENPDSFSNQLTAMEALRFNPDIDPEVRKQIGLIVPLSPRRYRALVRLSRERRAARLMGTAREYVPASVEQ